jgi:hypothetical protein
MVGFNENSTVATVNRDLAKYDFELKNLEHSLREVKAIYSLANMQRNIPRLKTEIRQLISLKREVVRSVDDFMKASKRWKKAQRKSRHKGSWVERKKANFIKKDFKLEGFFEEIDRKVNHLKKNIRLFKKLRYRIAKDRKLVEPHTVIILVWTIALRCNRDNRSEKFKVVVSLLEWFSKHRKALLLESIGQERKYLTPEAVRRDYERYIANPSRKMRVYSELAYSIYAESFSELGD